MRRELVNRKNNERQYSFAKKRGLPNRAKIVTSASVIALIAAGAVTPALGQTDESVDPVLLEEVLVTGQRASIQSAQAIKRQSEVMVDSVTAVDIGALPDRSVSEALQRIPGVQIQRTNENRDPARLAAEGGAVFVRGLSWVRTELNGRDIFSATSGRSLGFEDVSADLMAGVDVYKSPAADMIEGGIGGTVNLRTRLPFDSDEMVLAGAVDYNYAELYEEGFPSANALFSNRWDTGIGEIGFLASVSVAEIGNRTDSIQTGRYIAYDASGAPSSESGQPAQNYLPAGLGFRRIDWEQERNAFATAVQWAPNEQFTLTMQALLTEANPVDVERTVGINPPWQGNITPGSGTYSYDNEGFLTGGTINDAAVGYNTRYGSRESETNDYSLNFEYMPNDNWTITGDIQRVVSTAEVLSMTAFTQLGSSEGPTPHSGVDADFQLGSDPSISVSDPARQQDKGEYWWAAAMDHIEDNEADSLATRLDVDYSFDDGFVDSISAGVRLSDRDTLTRQSGWNWAFLSNQFWGGANSPDHIAYLDEYAVDQTELYTFDNFFRGDIDTPAVGWFPKESLLSDNQNAYSHLQQTQLSGWGWTPLEAPEAYDLNPRGDNISAGINQQDEKTTASYVMIRFGDDEILGVPFDGNLGVRVVETETTARGRSGAGGVGDSCGTSNSEACTGAQAFVDDYNAQLGDYADYTNSYSNVLPSLNLRFMLTDELQMRFGASRSIVRPSFSQIRPSTTLSFDFTDDQFDPNTTTEGSGTAGSPDLKPTKADQLDASVEYYFTDSSSVTLSAFYKKLTDYVTVATETETLTYGGQTYDFEITRNINAAEGTLKGFEFAYQQFFDTLPSPFDGLGIQTNFTYIDNEGGANTPVNVFEAPQVEGASSPNLPVEGMSKTSYNFALMYEKYDVSARLAYNWRERYLLTTSAANINRPVWFNDYGQLDGSVFYTINDHVKLGLQVTNLLAERTTLDVGDTEIAGDYSWTEGDRRVAFVVRAQF